MMKSALLAAFLGIGFAAAFRDPYRKTLRFGQTLPSARFVIIPNSEEESAKSSDPLDIAKQFIRKTVGDDVSFDISNASHTDSNTGVTHVYAQQRINGLLIDNAQFNLNIKNGIVLSYGDSFHRGTVDTQFDSLVDPHSEHCEGLKLYVEKKNISKDDVIHLKYKWICEHRESDAVRLLQKESNSSDPRAALMHFMISASVEDSPKLMSDPLNTLSKIKLTSNNGEYVAENVEEALKPVKATLAYVQIPVNGTIKLIKVWKFDVTMKNNHYEAAVSVDSPHRIISVVDSISDSPIYKRNVNVPTRRPAIYRVFRFGDVDDPNIGNRTLETELGDKFASPAGWHSFPSNNESDYFEPTFTTWGNNVIAQENWDGDDSHEYWKDNYRPNVNKEMIFDFPYKPTVPKKTGNKSEDVRILTDAAKNYIDASLTQMFYIANMIHDLFYRYGFDEKSGNFQFHNFGRGGKGGDVVFGNAQDGAGFNNANFDTPPDGKTYGRMRMYLWNETEPYRDGDMQADIIIHELTHGLSIRLTGGADNIHCMGSEGAAMGEGWGDFMAAMIFSEKEYSDISCGPWTANDPSGIRLYPYSVDKEVNPQTYGSMDQEEEQSVHKIGAVWAEILFVVAQRMIKKHGFSETLYPPKQQSDGSLPNGDFYRPKEFDKNGDPKPRIPKHGNTLIVQLVINAMKHQPCRPSFFQARDAIIDADRVLTGGENFCELWRGFADRGLGTDAEFGGYFMGIGMRTDGFMVPKECRE